MRNDYICIKVFIITFLIFLITIHIENPVFAENPVLAEKEFQYQFEMDRELDLELALLSIKLSRDAYNKETFPIDDRTDYRLTLTEEGFTDIKYYDGKVLASDNYAPSQSMKAVVGFKKITEKAGIIAISFKGSYELGSWITDLAMDKVPLYLVGSCEECKVHRGFQDYVVTLIESVKVTINNSTLDEIIQQNANGEREDIFWITGHSLGGAAATLYGAHLSTYGIKAENNLVYTFGAPMVANVATANYLDGKFTYHRFFDQKDLVAKSLANYGYTHFGEPYELISNRKVEIPFENHLTKRYRESLEDIIVYGKTVDTFEEKIDVSGDHKWKIKFNTPIHPDTVNIKNVYVKQGSKQLELEVNLQDERTIVVNPPPSGYESEKDYNLYIKNIRSSSLKPLKSPVTMHFTIGKLATAKDLAKTRYKTVIKDENGVDYNLYLIPEKEKQVHGSYRGNYGFVLQRIGSDIAVWQKEEVKDYIFNEDFGIGEIGKRDMVSVIKGKTETTFDLLALSERWTTNDSFLRLYVIYEEKLIKLKMEGDSTDSSILSALPPKFINSDTIQNVTYSNQNHNFGWEYENYRINSEIGLLEKIGKSILYGEKDFEEGRIIADRWFDDPDYFVK